MKLFFLFLFATCVYTAHAYSCIEAGPTAPESTFHRFPYFTVYYEPTYRAEIPQDTVVDVPVRDDQGYVHRLRYLNGWWYDESTGIGFPANYGYGGGSYR